MQVWTGIDRRSGSASQPRLANGMLRQAIERQLRLNTVCSVLVLHLSRLMAPAPHPHHRRVAQLVMDDAAQLHGGQVFARPDGDLVMISAAAAAMAMVDTMTRLFRTDAPGVDQLFSLWSLPTDAAAVLGYASLLPAQERQDDVRAPMAMRTSSTGGHGPDGPSDIGAIDGIGLLVRNSHFCDVARRQAAIRITHDGAHVLYHEVSFSAAALHTGQSDPFLFRHLAARLDARLLEAVAGELLDGGIAPGSGAIHLNLTLHGMQSAAFARFAAAAHGAGIAIGVEIQLLEACADPPAFAAARNLLRGHGFRVVLDSVSHPALLLTTPEALEPDLVKLDWTPRLAALPHREQRQLTTALQRLDPERIVLHRAETEAAFAWGRSHGIRRFQGRHVDAMMAAGRMTTCAHATGCSFRQCIERAAATGHAGRTGCLALPRLNGGGELWVQS